ncbi:MAG: hypothetical protein J0L63_10435, partial [Anaerolineae bacterium]|nr:hypothetical protein [Anaerolineae bacterium]
TFWIKIGGDISADFYLWSVTLSAVYIRLTGHKSVVRCMYLQTRRSLTSFGSATPSGGLG